MGWYRCSCGFITEPKPRFGNSIASVEADVDDEEGRPMGFYQEPKWMAVSLDLFGL